MKSAAVQDLKAEEDRVTAQLRQQLLSQALDQAVVKIKSDLKESDQSQIIDQSLALLGGS
jgi:F-type H+-transporting ATPase subunit b